MQSFEDTTSTGAHPPHVTSTDHAHAQKQHRKLLKKRSAAWNASRSGGGAGAGASSSSIKGTSTASTATLPVMEAQRYNERQLERLVAMVKLQTETALRVTEELKEQHVGDQRAVEDKVRVCAYRCSTLNTHLLTSWCPTGANRRFSFVGRRRRGVFARRWRRLCCGNNGGSQRRRWRHADSAGQHQSAVWSAIAAAATGGAGSPRRAPAGCQRQGWRTPHRDDRVRAVG